MVDHIQPSLSEIAFLASELSGLAECSERARPIGLHSETARGLLAASDAAMLSAASASVLCTRAASSFRNFFLWIQQQMRW